MRLKVSGKTDIGQKRKINQDSILMDSKSKLFVVADGMGGHKGGEVASRMACEAIQRVVQEALAAGVHSPMELLRRGFEEATQAVYLEANKPGGDDLHGMGTTMVALFIYEKVAYIANVGDSRAYVFKNDLLWKVTEDHSWVNEQLRSGVIQEADLEHVQGKNVITRSVGFAPEVNVDIFYRELQVGEKYLLCSDGLHGLVTDTWIQNRISTGSMDTFVDDSVLEANNNGGDDNVTCLFVEVES
ncbi:MAG: Stp1/IreP family PP2C-type Ser/Thr phosphatase [Bdellovibrionales bacterium]